MSTPTPKPDSMGPADELLDPRRRDLITMLSHVMDVSVIDSIGRACLWFADLSVIEALIKAAEQSPWKNLARSALSKNDSRTTAIRAWAVRAGNTARSSEDSGEPSEDEATETKESPTKKRRLNPDPRKTSQIPKWIERDDDICILTGCSLPVEVAHIFPRSLGKKGTEGVKDFWNALECFWTPQQLEAWKEQVLGPDGVETCSNLMCMTNLAHELWEKAVFALKPLSLSEDKRHLEVQFYWLPMNKYRRTMSVTAVPEPFPRNLSSTNDTYKTVLWNMDTDTRVCSGDILTFKTDDPVGHPLPSMELLNMQWILHRVLALSGAANATEKELFPDHAFGVYEEDSDWNSEMEVEEEE
ncbi:hypothetical protein ASPBRDRAFT_55379 [Aspergillus brasiliensis CBS 101740]|uniref:HNH nuclease domain-containing protein n=1 Tax=Aspergillus brasiliensis (strain CBS 101740 / IMI 381727 / IBT 21946) TaxID=767769 RepID=A0A1L9UKI4_ASPBC|nr:hypothetical protein ASPBRDRAFT_55379 [Aspergillus brasiliensis CBS 101740]